MITKVLVDVVVVPVASNTWDLASKVRGWLNLVMALLTSTAAKQRTAIATSPAIASYQYLPAGNFKFITIILLVSQ